MRSNCRNGELISTVFCALLAITVSTSSIFAAPPDGKGKNDGDGEPPTPNWEFIPEEGGWLDWNTGLVWGENTYEYYQRIDPESYAMGSWDDMDLYVLPAYRFDTGFEDWRFPSNAELQQAAASSYAEYAFPDGVEPWTFQVVTWTADGGGGRYSYYGSLVTGEVDKTVQSRSSINLTPVRRASFWP